MRHIEQAIIKNVQLCNEYEIIKRHKQAVWKFYNAYGFALAMLGLSDPQQKRKDMLIARFLCEDNPEYSDLYPQILSMIAVDSVKISEALALINKMNEESTDAYGDAFQVSKNFYPRGTLAYEILK